MRKNIATVLLFSLLVSHHVNASEPLPELPPLLPEINQVPELPASWLQTHKEIIIPVLFVTGVGLISYCLAYYEKYREDNKPLETLLKEAQSICHDIRGKFYAQDEALITIHPSHLLVAEKVLAHCPGEHFAYSIVHNDINTLIEKAEVKLMSLERRNLLNNQVRVAVTELRELIGWLKRLDGIITSHPSYLKEQQEKFFQDEQIEE